jgi:hypothetical protein
MTLLDPRNNLEGVTNSQFAKYMKDKDIVEELSTRLFNMHNAFCNEYNAKNPCSVPMQCNLKEIKENMP